jgi:hypothetical protein
MFADPKKVDVRRLRRRLKAGAAVALAMVAGAFLACKGEDKPAEPPSPSGPDARSGPGSRIQDDAGNADAAQNEADAGVDAAKDGAEDASNDAPNDALAVTDAAVDGSTGLAVRDAGADAAAKARRVDKHEHRKGMPVRDNLLE